MRGRPAGQIRLFGKGRVERVEEWGKKGRGERVEK